MADYVYPTVIVLAAFAVAWVLILGAVGSLRLTRSLNQGLMHHVFYALFFSNGMAVLLSTRNFAATGELFEQSVTANPLSSWLIRLTSLLIVVASADQVARRFRPQSYPGRERLLLAGSLILFWCGNILIPSVFSTHSAAPQINWLYAPILGIGLIFMSREGGARSLLFARNAILVFCAISLALIALRPDLVLQSTYTQGYIGIARFAGLAPHAIVMGLNACVGLWLLMTYPLQRKPLQYAAMAVCVLALGLAQSKAVWISFIITLPILLYHRNQLPSFSTMASPKYRGMTAALLVGAIVLVVLASAYLSLGSLGDRVSRFLASDQGSQITSFTGRDKIWEVAMAEWAKSPIFGYGLKLFGVEHQIQIGMPFATSGHNQFIDALGRSGLVGAATTAIYTLFLLYFGMKYAKASKGLSAVLCLSIVIRTISEVPLSMGNLGIDATSHYVLLAVLASCIGAAQAMPQDRLAGLATRGRVT